MSNNKAPLLTETLRSDLIAAALAARDRAYVPYSHFPVGAAVLTSVGAIYSGCNIENATFGATVCAERTAVFKAVSEGDRDLSVVAVVTANGASPCGICRQVLYEFNPEIIVIVAQADGQIVWEGPVTSLLPLGFGPKKLADGQEPQPTDAGT
ncbi:MAG: cytidine deaminase [Chloroflexi bacterium]|nr:cytidine deaminase [Chloroflexota bacterium]